MNERVDVLELKVEPSAFPAGQTRQIVPYVNGRSVWELHLASRKAQAGRVGRRKQMSSSDHAGLAAREGAIDLSDLRPRPGLTHQAPVLGCACGEAWCNPLLAELSAGDDIVTWRMPRMTFRFERRQYEETLRAAEETG